MKKFQIVISLVFCISCIKTKAAIILTATTNTGNPSVMLQWNMVNYPGNTAYILFKSIDGVVWETSASNPVLRNYTSSTILAYHDNFSDEQKLYYKVKVYDASENIVAISNTAIVDNPKNSYATEKPPAHDNTTKSIINGNTNNNVWQIYPNPVGNMLNLVYKGRTIIRGVINVVILDATGKVVIKFRAASVNKQLYIEASKLHTGFYFIRIYVLNEVQMNEKFIKQ
jgi:hypothetical protein